MQRSVGRITTAQRSGRNELKKSAKPKRLSNKPKRLAKLRKRAKLRKVADKPDTLVSSPPLGVRVDLVTADCSDVGPGAPLY